MTTSEEVPPPSDGEPRGLAVRWVRFGAEAEDALHDHVDRVRAVDPLARISVLVPTRFEALTLRRRLAARAGGTVGVQLEVVDDLASLLALPLLAGTAGRPLTDDVHDLLVEEAARRHPGALGRLAGNPATLSALSRAVTVLRAAVAGSDPEPTLAALVASDERGGLGAGPSSGDHGNGDGPAGDVAGPQGQATGSGGGIRTALATIYREYRRLVGTDHHDHHDVVLTAAAADPRRVRDVAGTILVHLPAASGRPATPSQARLLQRLAHHTHVTILAGWSGDPRADATTSAHVGVLAGRMVDVPPLGPTPTTPPDPLPSGPADEPGNDTPGTSPAPPPRRPEGDAAPGPTRPATIDGGATAAARSPDRTFDVVVVPDAHEEAATATRLVTAALHDGVDPADLQILYPVDDPYATLVSEALSAADLPHHGPPLRNLAQTDAGRVLDEIWTWQDEGHPRARLLDLLGSTPVRVDGRPAPAGSWDRVARRAGIVGGVDQWDRRLAGWSTRTLEDAAHSPDWLTARLDRDAAAARDLRDFVLGLVADLEDDEAATWRHWADRTHHLLDRLLGTDRSDWSITDRDAEGTIRQRVAALAHLDDVRTELDLADRPVGRVAFRRAVRTMLATPSGRVGRAGVGVRVARLDEAGTTEVRHSVIVGAVEGALPPRPRPGPFLPDDVVARLRAAGVTAPVDGDGQVEARRRALARVLATSARTTLVVPRIDRREQRPMRPGPWVLDLLASRLGRPVTVDEVLDPAPTDSGPVRRVDSALAGMLDAATPAGPDELRLRALAAHVLGAGGDLRTHDLSADLDGLRTAVDVVEARRSTAFTPWDGNLAGLEDRLRVLGEAPQSPNGLAQYGQCPRRWLFDRGLRIRREEEPRRWLDVDALDRGNLVHDTLEAWIREILDPPGSEPGGPIAGSAEPGSLARLREVFDHHGDRLEAAGRTGLVALWRQRRRRLWGLLTTWFDGHEDLVSAGWTPQAVEVGFGLGDDGGLQVATDDLTFTLRGRIDRVDVRHDDDGGVRDVAVLDYKTGRPEAYHGLADDIALAGTELQLPIYGLVAQGAQPEARVVVGYWHVHDRAPSQPELVAFDDAARKRTEEVLSTMARGIHRGVFPPDPGPESLWPTPGFEHCRWCPFTTICPSHGTRQREAEGAMASPEARMLLPLVQSRVLARDRQAT